MKLGFAQQYGGLQGWHWWFRGRRAILETVLRRELPGEDHRIASLGCGPAEGLLWLQALAGSAGRVVGVDLERNHAGTPAANVSCVVGRLESLPLRPRGFDAVLALDVLEHLDDDAAGLREAARLVAPGGMLLVTVPALPSLWGRQDVVSEHRRRYTRRTLEATFTLAGLENPRLTHFNMLLLPPIAVLRWLGPANGGGESDFEYNRPGAANELLAAVFGAERHLVGRVPMPVGVSLMAVWRSAPNPDPSRF